MISGRAAHAVSGRTPIDLQIQPLSIREWCALIEAFDGQSTPQNMADDSATAYSVRGSAGGSTVHAISLPCLLTGVQCHLTDILPLPVFPARRVSM